jgi:CreA protein
MGMGKRLGLMLALLSAALIRPALADDVGCLSTTFRFLGPNDKVCISGFDDPKVPGVACHISQARTGGIKGGLGLAEDPSRFSIACRQIGPISIDPKRLPREEEVYNTRTSILFKNTHVFRMYDEKRNTLIYLAISDKIIEGSPQSSLSTVPIMPWGQ